MIMCGRPRLRAGPSQRQSLSSRAGFALLFAHQERGEDGMPGLFSLDGQVVLLTGASRGLGWSMAEAMAEAGALVVLNGRQKASLEAKAEGLIKAGHKADVAAFDVSEEASAREG